MKKAMLCCLYALLPLCALAQDAGDNLVPNPGFEEYAIPPIGWFYKGVYFSKVMKFWTSPSAASPDAYGPNTRVPARWAVQGFGGQAPHTGKSMAGLTVYGCTDGKPHCREYVQVLLNEKLIPGQQYLLSFWVSSLPRGKRVNNIGASFSKDELRHTFDTLLALSTHLASADIVESPDGEWERLSWTFTADKAADYLLIGNFSPDEQTRFQPGEEEALPFAYYYLDDVSLTKQLPLQQLPMPKTDLHNSSLSKGMIVPLKNIYFDFDRDELMPRSYVELELLHELLLAQPGLQIRINGHTDNFGSEAYNLDLSERRAGAVVKYLEQKGISADRISYRGFGATLPIADNDTEEGRQMNRRVEFEVMEL